MVTWVGVEMQFVPAKAQHRRPTGQSNPSSDPRSKHLGTEVVPADSADDGCFDVPRRRIGAARTTSQLRQSGST